MARKKVEFCGSNFVNVARLMVRSDRLRFDDMGRLVEDPELLSSFNCLVDAVREASREELRFGDICAVESAYIVDIYCVTGLTEKGDKVRALFDKFNDDVARLERNAQTKEPANHSACGVSKTSLEVIEAALEISEVAQAISIQIEGEQEMEMRVPSRDAITALPQEKKKARKVDGEITGMGWGDERGTRIEVGSGAMYMVRSLAFDAAIDLVKSRAHVSGVAEWDRGTYVLDDPRIDDGPRQASMCA